MWRVDIHSDARHFPRWRSIVLNGSSLLQPAQLSESSIALATEVEYGGPRSLQFLEYQIPLPFYKSDLFVSS